MVNKPLPEMTQEVAQLLQSQLGLRRGKTLEAKVRNAGRLLPRRLRADAQVLIDSEHRWGHPKLQMQNDQDRITKAHTALVTHLKSIDPMDRLKGRILGILAVLAFNFLAIFAGIVMWMVWTERL